MGIHFIVLSSFFFTGLHFFHLLVGLLLLGLFFWGCSFQGKKLRIVSLIISEINLLFNLQLFYWHFLEVLWSFIFLILYLWLLISFSFFCKTNKNAGFIILLTSIFTFFFFGEIVNLTTFHRLNNNGFSNFSLSFFLLSFLSFLWIGAQFPQDNFLSYARILTLDYYFLLICILFPIIFSFFFFFF